MRALYVLVLAASLVGCVRHARVESPKLARQQRSVAPEGGTSSYRIFPPLQLDVFRQSAAPEGGGSTTGAVTLTGSQTISGTKTFSSVINSTVASGSVALQLTSGATICLRDAGTTCLSSSAPNTLTVAGGGTSARIDAGQFRSGGANVGLFTAASNTSATQPGAWIYTLNTDVANARVLDLGTANAVATNLNTMSILRGGHGVNGAGAGTFTFQIRMNGRLHFDNTDSSGTPGAVTINKPSGRAAVAIGAASVVVTNNSASATSNVIITPITDTANCRGAYVTPAAGQFTVTCPGGAAAANWTFSFLVVND